MRKTIPSILVVGVLFLLLGMLDLWRGVAPLFGAGAQPRLAGDDMLVLAIGVAALIGGAFVLRGHNWARWLLAAWMALHVAISVGKPTQLLGHLVIFGYIAYLLFRPPATAHFRSS